MSTESSEFDAIENYLFGHQTDVEKLAFEQNLAENIALKEALKLHQLEHRAMELETRADLKSKLDDWKAQKFESKKTSRFRSMRYALAAAASIALIMGSFFILNPSNDKRWIEHSFEATVSSNREIESGAEEDLLAPARKAMQDQDYRRAISLLEAIKSPDQQDRAQMLLIESYFRSENYDAAIPILKTRAADETSHALLRHQAEWLIALNYLAQEKTIAEGRHLLSQIANNPDHSHAKDALKLQKKLK